MSVVDGYHHGHGHAHAHVSPGRVLVAAGLTIVAAATEMVGSRESGSLFLTADAIHLLAHLGIFSILLMPATRSHERREDLAAIGVLLVIALIACSIVVDAVDRIRAGTTAPPPAFLLLSLVGLGANLATAYLFHDPARTRWSFRAALAHELADASVTVVALLGAAAIAVFGWPWIDPLLTLMVGVWLTAWAGRLLLRRVRFGPRVWALERD